MVDKIPHNELIDQFLYLELPEKYDDDGDQLDKPTGISTATNVLRAASRAE